MKCFGVFYLYLYLWVLQNFLKLNLKKMILKTLRHNNAWIVFNYCNTAQRFYYYALQ